MSQNFIRIIYSKIKIKSLDLTKEDFWLVKKNIIFKNKKKL